MTKNIAYFDCFSGASGDMILGALVDAGASLDTLAKSLASLPCGPITLSAEKVMRGAISATKVHVHAPHEHAHRGLPQISRIISDSTLPAQVKDNAIRVFTRLAEAEAAVHGCAVDKIHFHEVGALDAIADIVGACAALDQLGVARVEFSVLSLGGGTVKAAHGVLPVPAPATALLVRGLECRMGPVESELFTPTAAAILTTLGAQSARAQLRVQHLGYGAGDKEFPGHPNLLRVILGEAAVSATADEVWVVEANLDDATPQVCGYAIERLLAAGALDAWAAPIQMKKSRPAVTLCAIADDSSLAAVERTFFVETPTFGLRRHRAQRSTLEREIVAVTTPYGQVKIKAGRRDGKVVTATPEYEDCRRIATERGVSLREVVETAVRAYGEIGRR